MIASALGPALVAGAALAVVVAGGASRRLPDSTRILLIVAAAVWAATSFLGHAGASRHAAMAASLLASATAAAAVLLAFGATIHHPARRVQLAVVVLAVVMLLAANPARGLATTDAVIATLVVILGAAAAGVAVAGASASRPSPAALAGLGTTIAVVGSRAVVHGLVFSTVPITDVARATGLAIIAVSLAARPRQAWAIAAAAPGVVALAAAGASRSQWLAVVTAATLLGVALAATGRDPLTSFAAWDADDLDDEDDAAAIERVRGPVTESMFPSLVAYSSDIVTVIDAHGYVQYQSHAAVKLLGRHPETLVGHPIESVVHPDDQPALLALLDPARLHGSAAITVELRMERADGTWCATETTITNHLSDPTVGGIVLSTRYVGERKDLEEQLRIRVFADPLTGLGNRTMFRERLDHAVARVRRYKGGLAVMFIDLDGFKIVNDTAGHDAGDQLLVEVANRFRHNLRTTDTVARMGGDEFAVLLEHPDDARQALTVATRLLACLQTPIVVAGLTLRVSCSIGLAITGGANADSSEDLLRNADLAMYRGKGLGKNQVAVYEPQMRHAAMTRVLLEKELRRAIDGDELVLHYQPIASLRSGQLTGVEALVRWNHPERGLIPPNEFIPIAEESGLIVELGRWALLRAAVDVAAISEVVGDRTFWVSVNVATRQLLQPGLLQAVRAALSQSGLAPERLVLEITEGALLNDPRACAGLMHQLRSLGVRLAIDDFGTGYSSLSRLRSFPVDKLKIDRSFIQEIGHAHDRAPIVAAVMAMAQSLGLTAVAEGVETIEQLACLHNHGCEEVQGFLLARPLPIGDLAAIFEIADNLLAVRGFTHGTAVHESPLSALVRQAARAGTTDPEVIRLLLGELARQLNAAGAFIAVADRRGLGEEIVLVSPGATTYAPEHGMIESGDIGSYRVLLGADVPAVLARGGVASLTLVPILNPSGVADRVLGVMGTVAGPLPPQHVLLMELLTRLLGERAAPAELLGVGG